MPVLHPDSKRVREEAAAGKKILYLAPLDHLYLLTKDAPANADAWVSWQVFPGAWQILYPCDPQNGNLLNKVPIGLKFCLLKRLRIEKLTPRFNEDKTLDAKVLYEFAYPWCKKRFSDYRGTQTDLDILYAFILGLLGRENFKIPWEVFKEMLAKSWQ